MRRVFTDDQFDEWQAYISGGQPGGSRAAQVMFVCLSSPKNRPRRAIHGSGDPAQAQSELVHMEEAALIELFKSAEPLP